MKEETSMDQEPYPNQEDGCTKGLDGSRYQLMDVLGVGEGGNPWRMMRRRWSAAEFGELEEGSSQKWRIWWRWRVEVELWYGRWQEEMKEKVSHVCSQINRSVEWSQTLASISNSRVTITVFEWLYL